MPALSGETYELAFPTLTDLENPAYVSHGLPAAEVCAQHVETTFDAQRVFILASGSLSKNTNEVEKLKQSLGSRYAGEYVGMSAHTPANEVLAATQAAKEKSADCIVTIGGGSLIDGAKAMLLFLANDVSTIEGMYELYEKNNQAPGGLRNAAAKDLPMAGPDIPLISIPTTLSGGEYSHYAGVTDPSTHEKIILGHPYCGPRLIIQDPKLTTTAPEWVWLSTGVRAVDHCVETLCRLQHEDVEADEAALKGFRLIVPSLLITKKDSANEEARKNAMVGVNYAMLALKKRIMPGASHGIGHQLGPLGVGHGETSCVLLPSVMKWNKKVNGAKQDILKGVIWQEAAIAEVLRKRGLNKESSDVGDALDAIFRELGMPRLLKEVKVGRDKFGVLAENSLRDPCCQANPIPIMRKEQVLEILEMCAE